MMKVILPSGGMRMKPPGAKPSKAAPLSGPPGVIARSEGSSPWLCAAALPARASTANPNMNVPAFRNRRREATLRSSGSSTP